MIKVEEIRENIFLIKITDPDERSFHGTLFPVTEGVSYAAYLILDEQVTLIDTFEEKFYDLAKPQIDQVLAGRKIDNIIIQHVEPDHSASFQLFKQAYPEAKAFCSKVAVKEMRENFFFETDYTPVSHPDSIKTGKFTLHFFETPNVHWPDNMWTYLEEEKILFSNDGFGQLIADDIISDEEIPLEKLLAFSKEYYCNIVFPNNSFVLRALKRFTALNWDIGMVCPSHGIIIKKHFGEMVAQYASLASEEKENKAVIVYETIWGNTRDQGEAIKRQFEAEGIPVKIYQLSKSRISEIITEAATAAYILIGTGNQNNCTIPIVSDFVERMKALKAKKAKVLIFGSYGWSQSPFKEVCRRLEEFGYDVFSKPLTINFKLNEKKENAVSEELHDFLGHCRNLA
ncbi:MAG: FprA family A-type flavoprotein [Turicibacter sp.]|nr:FprA family A-type flavoprotein [Turicibacter sp.]